MINKVIIIAEAGVNHNGDINLAKKLIDVAKDAEVDFVKFQTFKAETIVSPEAKKADYQAKNIGDENDSQFQMLKQLELSHDDHLNLMAYCKEKNIRFFSTAYDVEGVNYLNTLGLNMFKVPSGEITNYPYLRAIAHTKKPVILSTGMANLEEIRQAIIILEKYGTSKKDISILHCNTEYPTPIEDVNLRAMLEIADTFGVQIGYSDHTLGIEVPIAAVALGACIIEKHFTLDRNLAGPDHRASLEPLELKNMVQAIRNIELAMSGSGIKEPSKSELKNISIARKSIYVKFDLEKGSILTEDMLIPLRPGDGISAISWEQVIGKQLVIDKTAFDKIMWDDIK